MLITRPVWARRERAGPGGPRSVVMVINALTVGGAETQFIRLAAGLVQAGFAVQIVTLQPNPAFGRELRALGIKVHQLSLVRGMQGPSAILQLSVMLLRRRPDVVVSFLFQSNLVSRIAAFLARTPWVVSSIRNEYFGGRTRELLMRFTDRLADVTVTNSQLAASSLVRRRVVSAKRLVVVPNGLDVCPFDTAAARREATRQKLGMSPASFLFLGIGRLTEQKSWADLLEAAGRVADERARWIVAGEGRLREELEGEIAARGLTDRFTLLGVRDDVPDLLAASDALVLSSIFEGLPNVVLEAMAASRPVIATRVGGVPELVSEETGWVVAASDPAALAQAMCGALAAATEDLAAKGDRARDEVLAGYELKSVTRRWLGVVSGPAAAGVGPQPGVGRFSEPS
jgi:glycosyltransferase involved in cell wall biosynthesis